MSIIYLDDVVSVKLSINGIDTTVSGDILSSVKTVFGDAIVFLGCARLAFLVLNKNMALNSMSKIGIVIGSGSGGLTSYKVVNRTLQAAGMVNYAVILNEKFEVANVGVVASGSYKIPNHPFLDLLFGLNLSKDVKNIFQAFTIDNSGQFTLLKAKNNIPILEALNATYPDCNTQFKTIKVEPNLTINSPYEGDSAIISFLIDNLTDHLYLTIISIYLLLMLLLIFICKLVLSSDIEFKRISKIQIFNLSLGEKIAKLLTWFISIWQKNSSFWIFFIIIMLVIFNGVSLFSISTMLKILKNIS